MPHTHAEKTRILRVTPKGLSRNKHLRRAPPVGRTVGPLRVLRGGGQHQHCGRRKARGGGSGRTVHLHLQVSDVEMNAGVKQRTSYWPHFSTTSPYSPIHRSGKAALQHTTDRKMIRDSFGLVTGSLPGVLRSWARRGFLVTHRV